MVIAAAVLILVQGIPETKNGQTRGARATFTATTRAGSFSSSISNDATSEGRTIMRFCGGPPRETLMEAIDLDQAAKGIRIQASSLSSAQ
jgi:hypothetical protein